MQAKQIGTHKMPVQNSLHSPLVYVCGSSERRGANDVLRLHVLI